MTRHNFHNTNKDGSLQQRIKKFGIAALTNVEYAITFQPFINACNALKVVPTGRQAGKFRQKKGLVYKYKEVQNVKTNK